MTSETKTSAAEPAPQPEAEALHPIVVDLGKRRRKRIKELKRGGGMLMEEVAEALEQVRAALGEAGRGRVLVPVVFLYRQKRRRSRGLGLPFGL
jgi:Family of unknown function (DUF6200)